MKDKRGNVRLQCLKNGCDCDEYSREKDFDLCAYCEHTPVAHGNLILCNNIVINVLIRLDIRLQLNSKLLLTCYNRPI